MKIINSFLILRKNSQRNKKKKEKGLEDLNEIKNFFFFKQIKLIKKFKILKNSDILKFF